MAKMVAAGPEITTPPEDAQISMVYESFNLHQLRPTVFPFDKGLQVLDTLTQLPKPEEASSTLPEVVGIIYETPITDPIVAFDSYVRGVACAALILPPEAHPFVKSAVLAVAERLQNAGDLPPIALEFQEELRTAERAIFRNGEPISFRSLLAFMQGSYWLLGFVKSPRKKRRGVSPVDYVDGLIKHWAALCFVPQ